MNKKIQNEIIDKMNGIRQRLYEIEQLIQDNC